MGWVVIRYKFNEETLCWEPQGYMVFSSDDALLKFFESQAKHGKMFRYEITKTAEG